MNNKWTLEINEKQAQVIQDALDSFSRAKLGQINYALEHVANDLKLDRQTQELVHEYAKSQFFPELEKNEFYGIHSQEISDDARIAYDIIQVIRYALAQKNGVTSGVSLYSPCKSSTSVDLPKIEEK